MSGRDVPAPAVNPGASIISLRPNSAFVPPGPSHRRPKRKKPTTRANPSGRPRSGIKYLSGLFSSILTKLTANPVTLLIKTPKNLSPIKPRLSNLLEPWRKPSSVPFFAAQGSMPVKSVTSPARTNDLNIHSTVDPI